MVNRYVADEVWSWLMERRKPGQGVNDVLKDIIISISEPIVIAEELTIRVKELEIRERKIQQKEEELKKLEAEIEVAKYNFIQLVTQHKPNTNVQTSTSQPQMPTSNQPLVQPNVVLGKFTKKPGESTQTTDGRCMQWGDQGKMTIWSGRRPGLGKGVSPACEEICTVKDTALFFGNLQKKRTRIEDIAKILGISEELAWKHSNCQLASCLRKGIPYTEEELFPEFTEPTPEELKAEESGSYE